VIGTPGAPLAGNITTQLFQLYHDDVELGVTPTTLTSLATDVTFDRTLNGASALTVNAFITTFGGTVGNATPLISLTTDLPGITHINGGLVTTTAFQLYHDDATLGALITNLNAGTDVTFDRTLNGNSALTVKAPGVTTFRGSVGNSAPLISLTTDYQAGLGEKTVIGTGGAPGAGNVTTQQFQLYKDDVVLGVAVTTLTARHRCHLRTHAYRRFRAARQSPRPDKLPRNRRYRQRRNRCAGRHRYRRRLRSRPPPSSSINDDVKLGVSKSAPITTLTAGTDVTFDKTLKRRLRPHRQRSKSDNLRRRRRQQHPLDQPHHRRPRHHRHRRWIRLHNHIPALSRRREARAQQTVSDDDSHCRYRRDV